MRARSLMAFLLVLALGAAACAPAATSPTPAPATPGAATPTPAAGTPGTEPTADPADWQAGGGAEWERVLAAARQEGVVTIAGFPFLAEPMAQAFERDTGIRLEWLGGTGAELSARLAQEAASGQVTIDAQLGIGSDPFTLYPQGYLQDIAAQLLLPGVTEGGSWVDGEIKWLDPEEQFFVQASEYVHGWAIINADIINPSELTSWQDLLKPEYKGRIASYDVKVPGPGQGAALPLYVEYGADYVKQLFVDQEVTYTSDGGQLVEWAARGTYPIVLGTVQSNVERFRAQNFNLQAVLPGYLTGGFSPIKQVKGVPHPNAATVFINWYLSRPGQEVYAGVMLEQSRRTDVQVENMPDYVDPATYPHTGFDGYDWDFYTKQRSEVATLLVEALGGR
jgi:ABC-type Fe3+ transport system substrate-binding protein